MESSTTPKRLPGGRIVCTVKYPEERAEEAQTKALTAIGASMKIEGFRPGKAPLEIVRAHADADAVFEETVRLLLPATFQSLLKEHGIKPIIHPKVAVENRSPLTLVVTFVERPEVTVKGAAKIRIKKKPILVDTKDVERMVTYLQRQKRSTATVDRAALMGDEVAVDFAGKDKEGHDIEGTKAEGYRAEIGSKALIPGFEEALIGVRAGETKTFTVTFPENYHTPHLRGKEALFTATVRTVFSVTMPAFDDAFAINFGAGSAEELRRRIETEMRAQEERIDRTKREQLLLEEIRTHTKVSVAPELLEEEIQTLLSNLSADLERQGKTSEDFFRESDKSPVEMREELRKNAEKRITVRLGLQKIVEERNVAVSEEEMQKAIEVALEDASVDQKSALQSDFAERGERYLRLKWQKQVEKLIAEMLM